MIFFLKVKGSFVVFKIRPAEIDEEYIPVFLVLLIHLIYLKYPILKNLFGHLYSLMEA